MSLRSRMRRSSVSTALSTRASTCFCSCSARGESSAVDRRASPDAAPITSHGSRHAPMRPTRTIRQRPTGEGNAPPASACARNGSMRVSCAAVRSIATAIVPRTATTARTRTKAASRRRPAQPAARGAIGGRPASVTSRRSAPAHAAAQTGSSTTVLANSQVSQPAAISTTRYANDVHGRRVPSTRSGARSRLSPPPSQRRHWPDRPAGRSGHSRPRTRSPP